MKGRQKTLAQAAQGVQAALKSSDLLATLRPHLAKTRWADVVGPQVAGVTQAEKIQNGTVLVVRVKNSVWANELVLLKGDMLRRLNLALGGAVLTDIRFKASGLAKETMPASAPSPPADPTAEQLAQIPLSVDVLRRLEAAVQPIGDEVLRGRLRASLLRAARTDAWKQARQWQPCARCGTLVVPSQAVALCPLCRIIPASATTTRD